MVIGDGWFLPSSRSSSTPAACTCVKKTPPGGQSVFIQWSAAVHPEVDQSLQPLLTLQSSVMAPPAAFLFAFPFSFSDVDVRLFLSTAWRRAAFAVFHLCFIHMMHCSVKTGHG